MSKDTSIQWHRSSTIPAEADLTVTEAATAYLRGRLQQENGLAIRLSLKRAGCSGWLYVLDYVAQGQPQDWYWSSDTLSVFVDAQYYPMLKGLTIDYLPQGLNKKIVFNNPNTDGECGCGESFHISD